MSAPKLSESEAATVVRFELAPDADESLRERVARAICAARSDIPWDVQAGWQQRYYRTMAVAAIAVIRGRQ